MNKLLINVIYSINLLAFKYMYFQTLPVDPPLPNFSVDIFSVGKRFPKHYSSDIDIQPSAQTIKNLYQKERIE